MKTYLLVLRRQARGTAPDAWRDVVSRLQGVEVEEDDERLQLLRIRATDEAIGRIREELGEWLHVEEPEDSEPRE